MVRYLGIDLGTSNVVLARVTAGSKPPTLLKADGKSTACPAIFNMHTHSAGIKALTEEATSKQSPENMVSEYKKFLGVSPEETKILLSEGKYPYQMKAGKFRSTEGELFAPEEITAAVLKSALAVEADEADPEIKAVITVPAYFNEPKRRATSSAAEIAGITVMEILNEPTAAALAYNDRLPEHAKALVVDFGGGTLDIAAVLKAKAELKVKATAGDPHLGGKTVDKLLADLAFKKFRDTQSRGKNKCSPPDKRTLAELRQKAQQAKHRLTLGAAKATIALSGYNGGKQTFEVELLKSDMVNCAQHTINRAVAHIDNALVEAGWKATEVSHLILAGGSMRLPMMKDLIVAELPMAEILDDIDFDNAIALGAARHLQSLLNATSTDSTSPEQVGEIVKVTDLATHSVGIVLRDDVFARLVSKGSPLPTTASDIFATTADFQTRIVLQVVTGEDPRASYNEVLGVFGMEVLPMPAGELKVKVTFRLSVGGLLNVQAEEVNGTGRKREVEIAKKAPEGAMTPTEITQAKARQQEARSARSSSASCSTTDAEESG